MLIVTPNINNTIFLKMQENMFGIPVEVTHSNSYNLTRLDDICGSEAGAIILFLFYSG